MAQVIATWFLTQATMASILGDWFFIKEDYSDDFCNVYKGDGHNLFGKMCGKQLTESKPIVQALQGMILTNLALSILLFFTTITKPTMVLYKLATSVVIMILGIIVVALWHTTNKGDVISSDIVNYFGVGWVFQLVTVFFAFVATILNIIG